MPSTPASVFSLYQLRWCVRSFDYQSFMPCHVSARGYCQPRVCVQGQHPHWLTQLCVSLVCPHAPAPASPRPTDDVIVSMRVRAL